MDKETKLGEFHRELQKLINKTGMDAFCETPDFLLADYIVENLKAIQHAEKAKRLWKGGAR